MKLKTFIQWIKTIILVVGLPESSRRSSGSCPHVMVLKQSAQLNSCLVLELSSNSTSAEVDSAQANQRQFLQSKCLTIPVKQTIV